MDTVQATQTTTAELTDAIDQLHAIECLVRRRRLAAVAEYERREAYKPDGAQSIVTWLQTRLCQSRATALEEVRVARALEEQPQIAKLFENGELSWDQLRPATRLATILGEDNVIGWAPRVSSGYLERRARRAERVRREDVVRDASQRFLTLREYPAERRLDITGSVYGDDAAVIAQALRYLAERQPDDPDTGRAAPFAQRLADSLVQICKVDLAGHADADRATIVVHTTLETLAGLRTSAGHEHERCELQNGIQLAPETVQRLACSARIGFSIRTPNGDTVGIGRASRIVPAPMLHELWDRDGGCTLCGRQWCVEAHHILEWARGGRTDVHNLALLCSHCHWRVHEGGWRIHRKRDHTIIFIRPDGEAHTGPPALRADIRERLNGASQRRRD